MHQKHPPISRAAYDTYGRQELTFIGAPCGRIHDLWDKVAHKLSQKIRIGCLDMSHKESAFSSHFYAHCTDQLNHSSCNTAAQLNHFDLRMFFNNVDLLFVNGNHYTGKHQIVFLDSKKEASLERKLDRLTDVKLFVSVDVKSPYPFLQSHIQEWQDIPIISIENVTEIAAYIHQQYQIPPLNGLVLVGGKSSRMGADKSQITYRQQSQKDYLVHVLSTVCDEVFTSVAAGQKQTESDIADQFIGMGPMGAILSAFKYHPDKAFLVVACDMPFVDEHCIQHISDNRNASKAATAYYNAETGWPDPLLSIWEPRAYMAALQFLGQGYNCPRKVLINTDIELLQPKSAKWLLNANTPEERDKAKLELSDA